MGKFSLPTPFSSIISLCLPFLAELLWLLIFKYKKQFLKISCSVNNHNPHNDNFVKTGRKISISSIKTPTVFFNSKVKIYIDTDFDFLLPRCHLKIVLLWILLIFTVKTGLWSRTFCWRHQKSCAQIPLSKTLEGWDLVVILPTPFSSLELTRGQNTLHRIGLTNRNEIKSTLILFLFPNDCVSYLNLKWSLWITQQQLQFFSDICEFFSLI